MNIFKLLFSSVGKNKLTEVKKSVDTKHFSPYGTSSAESIKIQETKWRDLGEKIGKNQKASLIQLEHEKKLLRTKLRTIWKAQLDEINTTLDINNNEYSLLSKSNDVNDILTEAKLLEISSIIARLDVYKASIESFIDDYTTDPIYEQCEMELIAGFEAGASLFRNSEEYKQTIYSRLTSN